jgi:type VI secretion system protein ImpK
MPQAFASAGAQRNIETSPPHRENLALTFQEMFTVIVRIRSNRQAVTDAESFRANMRAALKKAGSDAAAQGYSPEYIKFASFAVVAFLDESVLNSGNPIFADWPRMPLGQELFGSHLAGEIFFQGLERFLTSKDSSELADLLEVYYLCLLLGYRGRYGVGGREATRPVADAVGEKVRRIRGNSGALSPAALPPPGAPAPRRDRWARRLGLASVICLIVALSLFGGFKASLGSRVSTLNRTAAPK